MKKQNFRIAEYSCTLYIAVKIIHGSLIQIVEVDSHIACAFSGLTADSKTLIDRARVESQNHWFTYDEKMQVIDAYFTFD